MCYGHNIDRTPCFKMMLKIAIVALIGLVRLNNCFPVEEHSDPKHIGKRSLSQHVDENVNLPDQVEGHSDPKHIAKRGLSDEEDEDENSADEDFGDDSEDDGGNKGLSYRALQKPAIVGRNCRPAPKPDDDCDTPSVPQPPDQGPPAETHVIHIHHYGDQPGAQPEAEPSPDEPSQDEDCNEPEPEPNQPPPPETGPPAETHVIHIHHYGDQPGAQPQPNKPSPEQNQPSPCDRMPPGPPPCAKPLDGKKGRTLFGWNPTSKYWLRTTPPPQG